MGPVGSQEISTTVTINNQGLVDLLQVAVSGLEPKKPYELALSARADGSGILEPIAKFMANPAGGAIIGTLGPLRKALDGEMQRGVVERRYLVIAAQIADGRSGEVVQVQR
jgi:hypothetical protein